MGFNFNGTGVPTTLAVNTPEIMPLDVVVPSLGFHFEYTSL